MATFNILRNATIRNAMFCRHDTNDGFSVTWDEDDNFKQYGEFGSLTTRTVWDNRYFAAATSGTVFIGPTTDQPPVDGGVFDLIKVNFRIEVKEQNVLPTTGRIQFQTTADPIYDDDKVLDFTINPDNAYNEYTVVMSEKKEWQGDITRVRLFPFVDGQPGDIVHFKTLKVQSSTTFTSYTYRC